MRAVVDGLQGLAAVLGAEQRRVLQIHHVLVVRVGEDVRVVEGPLADGAVVVRQRPGGPRVVADEQAAVVASRRNSGERRLRARNPADRHRRQVRHPHEHPVCAAIHRRDHLAIEHREVREHSTFDRPEKASVLIPEPDVILESV